MRITAVHATPVNIPYRSAARMAAGTSEYSTRTIIEIDTDAGLTGLGDASYAFAAGVIGVAARSRGCRLVLSDLRRPRAEHEAIMRRFDHRGKCHAEQ
jgi:L-alanine-DL-glutamate epimerase-like enolase superfamily enzyme